MMLEMTVNLTGSDSISQNPFQFLLSSFVAAVDGSLGKTFGSGIVAEAAVDPFRRRCLFEARGAIRVTVR